MLPFAFSLIMIFFAALLIPSFVPQLAGYAHAQQPLVTVQTSADSHDGRFFGESVLQVVVYDPDDDDDSDLNTKTVDIEAEASTGSGDSDTIVVPETSGSSGRFEFFLSHELATTVQPEDLDPLNNAGVEGDGSCTADCAPFVTFGPSGVLDIDSDLYEDVRFEIRVDDSMIVVNYEETLGELSLDRESYGSNSIVHVFVNDQDANLNPFERDEFVVDPDNSPDMDLFELDGGQFADDVTFRETGDNTGIFEGEYELGSAIDADSKSLALILHEKANYDSTLDAEENDSNNTDEVSFTVGNTSGSIGIITGGNNNNSQPQTFDAVLSSDKNSYTIGEIVTVNITDQDANTNSDAIESINIEAFSGSSANDFIILSAIETDNDSGIFDAKFKLGSNTNQSSKTIAATDGDVLTVRYNDSRPTDYAEKVARGEDPSRVFTLQVKVSTDINGSSSIQSTEMAIPSITDAAGHELGNSIDVGQQVVLSTTITNKLDRDQPFLAIVEVRTSDDVTILLEWQIGKLHSNAKSDIAVSWSPTMPGEYTVRAFAISGFTNGDILSHIAESKIKIGIS